MTPHLTPAEKAAQELYSAAGPPQSYSGSAVLRRERAAYINGDEAGYRRAKAEDAITIGKLQHAAQQFIKEVDSVTPELDLYPDDLAETREALRALAAGKE